MPDDIKHVIEIENLSVDFHTYQGVVRALDGVNLKIIKGEAFGLVGETGCGKSVTANTILRLIPMPPGKINSGKIFFQMPREVSERAEEIKREIRALAEKHGDGAPSIIEKRKQLDETRNEYDLLVKKERYLRQIRGKYISMIFQEPMSALNPVFTVGDQISEIMMLHESSDIAKGAIRTIDQEAEELKGFNRGKKVPIEKHQYECSICGNKVTKDSVKCTSCNASFKSLLFLRLGSITANFDRKMLKSLENSGYYDDLSIRFLKRIPIINRFSKRFKKEALERAERMLRLVRIPDPDKVNRSYPFELSGGMQQRVIIAMALACRPKFLIADEPTTALDVTIQSQILKLMKELQQELDTSILLITHNLGVVADVCDRVGVMYAGNIVEVGSKKTIFKEPFHPYTQGLINSIPTLAGDITRLETISGNVPNLIRPPGGCRFNPRCPFVMPICLEVKPELLDVGDGHLVACHLYGRVQP